jgi:hypothetical protein
MSRISPAQRLQLQNVAEREVMRYAHDHALWHKHVHNVELDPIQVLKCMEMDQHPNSIDFSSRRTGKTAVKELYLLKYNATHPDQEEGIVAPREAQSLVNLGYHLDAIRRSAILSNWIGYKGGRKTLADTYYQFQNRSKCAAYGIMAQVDGGDLTVASLEEVDDMPKDRLFSRFLLMLGSTRRLGASAEAKNDPQIRITGVFKGADTLTDLLNGGAYHALGCFHGEAARDFIRKLVDLGELEADAIEIDNYRFPVPVANAVIGAEMGLLNKEFIARMRAELPDNEYIRQLLCINTASRNLIWEIYIQRAKQVGLMAGLEPAFPLPGVKYKKRGLIGFGYDAGGHGENPQSSKHALVVTEQIGNFIFFPYCRTWSPGEDDMVVKRDLLGLWRYFDPDTAFGDAYGVGMMTALNDELYAEGLTHIDRRTIGDGDSTATTWPEWAFSPIRFEGMVKHSMAMAIRSVFHNKQAALCYVDDDPSPELDDFRLLARQLPNIVPIQTKASYASYKQADSKIGDDLFDAAMASVWGLMTRGAIQAPGVVLTKTTTKQQLLQGAR